MGTLRIEGKSIERLVFGNEEMLVLPPLVKQAISVPAGNYYLKMCDLVHDKDKPAISPQRLDTIAVKVAGEGENNFKLGCPLQNSVRIERTGSILRLNYELKGAGGEIYEARQITDYNGRTNPSVAIYKGNMQLASGSFEYG